VNKVAKWGHVKVLDWIAKYTSDWDKSTVFTTAIKTKNIKVLIWLKSQSTDDTSSQTWFGSIPSDCPHPSDLAFAVDDFEIFKWIHNQGCPWNDATDWVHRSRSEPYKRHFVNFAAKNGCPNADEVRFVLQKIDSSRRFRKQGYPSRWRNLFQSGERERFEDDDEEEEEEVGGGGEDDKEDEDDEDDEEDEKDDEDMEDEEEEEGEGEEEESE
jgi:hypothetical protein